MFLLLIVLLPLLFYVLIKPYRYWKDRGIAFSFPVPIFGNLASSMLRRQSFLHQVLNLYNEFPENRYFGFYQFFTPTLMLRDINLINKIAIKQFDSFVDHQELIPEDADPIWGKTLFAMTGDRWRDMRATLSPAFTSSKMRAMFPFMSKCAKEFTAHFLEEGSTVTLEIREAFTRVTTDVIASTAFGIEGNTLESKNNDFYLMAKSASNFASGVNMVKAFSYVISPRLMKFLKVSFFKKEVKEFFANLIKETVRVREKLKITRPDMIHLLMEARKGRLIDEENNSFAAVETTNVGSNLKRQKFEITDEDMTAQALNFFLGGFDTVSTTLSFIAYELALNPNVQEKLWQEVSGVSDECGDEITYDLLLGMKYLDMVISETLRKWPPLQITTRKCTKSFTIEAEALDEIPLHVEVGTLMWLPICAIHRDPRYYLDPDKFDPERFNDTNKSFIKSGAYLPFGAGPRNCIGSRYALLDCKVIIFHLVSKFEIIPVEKTNIPLEVSKSNIILMGEHGFWLGVKPRTSSM